MTSHKLVARIDDQQDGSFVVRSPAVGVVDGLPRLGVFLNPMEGFVSLTVLGRRHQVLLPRAVQGRVVEHLAEDNCAPVDFDQALFRLSQAAEEQAVQQGAASGGAVGVASDLIAVQAPSEGVFYCRPGPDSPAYVEPGSRVTQGSVLGLVEVMKSFNPITYGGAGLPEHGTVERVLVQDSAEVSFGQTLFLIRAG